MGFARARQRGRDCPGQVGLDRIVAVAFGNLSGNRQTFYSFIIPAKHEEIPRHRAAGQHFPVQILFANRDLQGAARKFKRLLVLTCCIHEPAPECQYRALWTGWRSEPRRL